MATRRFVTPQPGEDLAALAARALPGHVTDDAGGVAHEVLSWNLHLAARAGPGGSIGLLPSDLVFVEPPPRHDRSASDSASRGDG